MKTIEFDPLDLQSINRAIKELEKHEVWRKQRVTEYVKRLALAGVDAAQSTYGQLVDVKLNPSMDGVRAEGEQVVFLEFGTGTKVRDHALSEPLPISIEPGSWSESPEGQGTWGRWLNEQGGVYNDSPGYRKYPYDTTPRPGMWNAYKAIRDAQEKTAKEVFK